MGICGQEEVDVEIEQQVGLEFCEINIQGEAMVSSNLIKRQLRRVQFEIQYQVIYDKCYRWMASLSIIKAQTRVVQDGVCGMDGLI